jgi:uncharacterized protein involved in exopolysaccharide biosynthesis
MLLRDGDSEPVITRGNGHFNPGSSVNWRDWNTAAGHLWSQRGYILRWVLIGLFLSLGVAFLYPKYESTVQIMPPESGGGGLAALALPAITKMPGLAGIAGELLGAKNNGALFMKIMESRTVQDSLITRFDLLSRYHMNSWDAAREKLHSRTAISEDKKSGVITLSVRDHDKKIAADLAGAYVEELDRVVARVSTSSARRERVFVEQRIAEERKQLDDAEKQLSQFASSTMALDVPEQIKVTVGSAAKLQAELIAARAQLEGLSQIYTPDNFRIRALRGNVAELERELSKINSAPLAAGGSQDQTNPYPSVRSLPQLGVQWIEFYRTAKIHETVFELLTQQYELAKIQEAKEIPTVKVLDPPSTPERRLPSPVLIVEVGTLITALLACFSVFLRDQWNQWDPDDHRRIFLSRAYLGARQGAQGVLYRISHLRLGNGNSATPAEASQEEIIPAKEEEYSDRRS